MHGQDAANSNGDAVKAVACTEAEKPREDSVLRDDKALVEVEAAASAQVEKRLAEQDETIRSLREQVLRVQADFENYRRRQQNSLEDVKFVARESIISNILPLVDNLERALAAVQTTGNVGALAEGIKLILKQIATILQGEGLTEIESNGRPFDPAIHEVVMTEERTDVPDQQIVETLQKGYRLGSRVLRPSMVKVASNPDGAV